MLRLDDILLILFSPTGRSRPKRNEERKATEATQRQKQAEGKAQKSARTVCVTDWDWLGYVSDVV